MKNNEKKWQPIKNEKYNKNNYGKKSRNGRLPNIEFGAMSQYSILSVFNNEKNNEQWWNK